MEIPIFSEVHSINTIPQSRHTFKGGRRRDGGLHLADENWNSHIMQQFSHFLWKALIIDTIISLS